MVLKPCGAYHLLILLHQSLDLIVKTLFSHHLVKRSIFFFIAQLTHLDHLPPEPPSIHARFLRDSELPGTLERVSPTLILIFFFIPQFSLCNRLLILWPFQRKLFHRWLRPRKSDPHPPLAIALVTLLREDGFDALPARVLAFAFHLDIVYLGEAVIPQSLVPSFHCIQQGDQPDFLRVLLMHSRS